MTVDFFVALVSIAFGAGFFGSMLGIGGGVFLVPLFTLALKIPIHIAVGTSLVSVVATACAGANVYLRRGLPNLRLAMLLEVPTVIGAILGSMIAALLSREALSLVFAFVALYTAWTMISRQRRPKASAASSGETNQQISDTSGVFQQKLSGQYFDPYRGEVVHYQVQRLSLGLPISVLAGAASGMLGIGGGVIKVPIMNLAMRIPLKAAAATSNFMVGITAATSALIYYSSGFIDPLIAAPAALGVLLGASTGARFSARVDNRTLSFIFGAVLTILAIQMGIQSLR